MKKLMLLMGMAIGSIALTAPSSVAARNYDCSKAGNASKAACKTAGSQVKAATKASTKVARAEVKSASKSGASKIKTTSTTKITSERTYDCTKAGNKNKAACKSAASATAPMVKQSSTTISARHYDCTKAGNANKAVCKTSVTTSKATSVRPATNQSKMTPVARSAPAPRAITNAGPNGATAQCKDGTYSHAAHHRGECSHHGGVAKYF